MRKERPPARGPGRLGKGRVQAPPPRPPAEASADWLRGASDVCAGFCSALARARACVRRLLLRGRLVAVGGGWWRRGRARQPLRKGWARRRIRPAALGGASGGQRGGGGRGGGSPRDTASSGPLAGGGPSPPPTESGVTGNPRARSPSRKRDGKGAREGPPLVTA